MLVTQPNVPAPSVPPACPNCGELKALKNSVWNISSCPSDQGILKDFVRERSNVVQARSDQGISRRSPILSDASNKCARIEPERRIRVVEFRLNTGVKVRTGPTGELYVLRVATLRHVERRSALQRDESSQLPATENAATPWNLPHIARHQSVAYVVGAVGALRTSAIAGILTAAPAAINRLRGSSIKCPHVYALVRLRPCEKRCSNRA